MTTKPKELNDYNKKYLLQELKDYSLIAFIMFTLTMLGVYLIIKIWSN